MIMDLTTVKEIFQDSFYFKILLDIKRSVHDLESKNYLVELIKDISNVIFYENIVLYSSDGKHTKDSFFASKDMKKKVRSRRQWLHSSIYNSKEIAKKISDMGIDYSKKIYDMNLILNNDTLLSTNFENYMERYELYYYDEIFNVIECIMSECMKGMGLNDKEVLSIYSKFYDAIRKASIKCEKSYSGHRFSYSSFKLFSKSPFLTYDDKNFILQRYRLVSSVLSIEKQLKAECFELTIGPISIRMNDFFRKIKAYIIDIIGNDIRNPQSEYMRQLKKTIDQNILDLNFFDLIIKLRNNCHYYKITVFSKSDITLIDKYQNTYLEIVLKSFNDNLYIDIDNDDIQKTNQLMNMMVKN